MDALVWLGPREMVQRAEPMPRLADGEVLVGTAPAVLSSAAAWRTEPVC